MTTATEVSFDGLVGPTHHYGGLGLGNLASLTHHGTPSSPRLAALEGIDKMRRLADLGVRQAVLPPHDRPDVRMLRRLGFAGSDQRVLESALRDAPELLSACSSASSMWAANAATVSPSADTADGRVHLTPANLSAQLHRSLEAATTAAVLARVLPNGDAFAHHAPLPPTPRFADEGAANHLRLAPQHGARGIEIFVHGPQDGARYERRRFAPRQAPDASRAIARLHGLSAPRFVAQTGSAVDAGAFHADVIAVANENVLVFHADAFEHPEAFAAGLREAWSEIGGGTLDVLGVTRDELTLEEAVASYLFNSQIVTTPEGAMAWVAPEECREMPRAARCLERLLTRSGRLGSLHHVPLRQSMRNGGGPACLRLRVVLSPAELEAVSPHVWFDDRLERELRAWVERHHRDELHLADLGDPALLRETREALDRLTEILRLGTLYDFQKDG